MPLYHDLKSYSGDKADWIARRLLALRFDLANAITNARRPNSLIIGTWNIRAFDGGMPRLDESYHYIAEIIAAFDICAIQELRPDLGPIRRLIRLLGPNWDYFLTDVSDHEGGNNERMAFVYNRNRVFFRNIIGEIVIRDDAMPSGGQIARSPFFAAFQAGWFKFTLCSSHIVFGDDHEQRASEIRAITSALAKRAKKEDQVFIFLGDMNIERTDGPIMQALIDSDMEIATVPPSNMKGDKPYDQIAFTVKGKSTRKTRLLRSGGFDWRNAVFGPRRPPREEAPEDPPRVSRIKDADHVKRYEAVAAKHRTRHGKKPATNFARGYSSWTTHEMSDHLPVWVELEVDYSDQYLGKFVR